MEKPLPYKVPEKSKYIHDSPFKSISADKTYVASGAFSIFFKSRTFEISIASGEAKTGTGVLDIFDNPIPIPLIIATEITKLLVFKLFSYSKLFPSEIK